MSFQNNNKKFFAVFFVTLLLVGGFFTVSYVHAQYGLQETAGAANLTRNDKPSELLGNLIGSALSLVGVIFFALTIYAGITWMLARGNEEQTKKSLNTIIAAIIGLVITLAAYAITTFVFQAVSNDGTAPSNTPQQQTCESQPGGLHSCVANAEACTGTGGSVQSSFTCTTAGQVCCQQSGPPAP